MNSTNNRFLKFTITASAILAGAVFVSVYATAAFAFVGPSQNPPSGSGAIGSDSSNNMGVGTSTTISGTKLAVVGAGSNDAATYAAKFLQNNGTPIFILRDDGSISIETSTVSAGNAVIGGNLTIGGVLAASSFGGSIVAGNVTSGQFGSNFAGGSFSFPANVAIGTTTQSGLLSLYQPSSDPGLSLKNGAGSMFWINTVGNTLLVGGNGGSQPTSGGIAITNTGNVGIGTTTPGFLLTVNGTTSASSYCISGANCITAWPSGGGSSSLWIQSSTSMYTTSTVTNVGIGTTTPAAKLDVAGGINLKANGTNDAALQVGYTATAPAGYYATYAP